MASQSEQAKAHRERQALRPFNVPICAAFKVKKSHVHSADCFNHIPASGR